ncbi:hypothetical protein P5630_01240 [Bacillus subtilis]|uniref:Uncharacterized protein n=1 Tax=Bacillus subtilis TaxID=1423 RepID=A0A0D1IMW7_BACIU|nr:hypothetical protein SC09_Contig25orf00314 [Bacillus subtilis]WGD69417.1 hypothetical protein P5630_01240 [Bacillus subtilis]WGD73481.1 hypothetical protein P5668_21635 [Bacillus subtilis]WGD90595.1 hypothetical protein P5665_01230 [Bacillus subtilis]
MSSKEEKKIVVERVFSGTEKLEDLLLPFLQYEIDKVIDSEYDCSKASATPKGVAN